MKTTQRLFRLLDLLQSQTVWTSADLATALNVDARTIRRDIDRLREVGLMIKSDRGVGGGYQIRAMRRLPPLMLSDDEAVAVAVGLRTMTLFGISDIEELGLNALTKLEQLLPNGVKERIDALFSVMAFQASRRGDVNLEIDTLTLASRSCRDRQTLLFDYESRQGELSSRSVQPHYVAQRYHRWYLIGWDLEREDWRTFRLDRLSGLGLGKGKFERRELPDGQTPMQYIDASFSQLSRERQNTFTVSGPAEKVKSTIFCARTNVEPISNSETLLTITESSTDQIVIIVSLLATKFDIRPREIDDDAKDALRKISERLSVG